MWKIKMLLFDDTCMDDTGIVTRLSPAVKAIGFDLIYFDNDTGEHRENFIGSFQYLAFKNVLEWKDTGTV